MSSLAGSSSKAGRTTTQKKGPSAKESLVGGKSQVAGTSAAAALPKRAPFGQESDDDDDEVMEGALSAVLQAQGDEDEVMIGEGMSQSTRAADEAVGGSNLVSIDPTLKPTFKPLSKGAAQSAQDALDVTRGQLRKVPIPPHRMTPLKNEWPKIYTPLVEMAGLQVRMNVKRKTVEIKVSTDAGESGLGWGPHC